MEMSGEKRWKIDITMGWHHGLNRNIEAGLLRPIGVFYQDIAMEKEL